MEFTPAPASKKAAQKHKDKARARAQSAESLEVRMGVPALGMAGTTGGGAGILPVMVRTPHGWRVTRKG